MCAKLTGQGVIFFFRCSLAGVPLVSLKFDANPPPPMGVENPNTLRLAV